MGLTLGVRGVRGMHEQNAHTRALEIRIVGGSEGRGHSSGVRGSSIKVTFKGGGGREKIRQCRLYANVNVQGKQTICTVRAHNVHAEQ